MGFSFRGSPRKSVRNEIFITISLFLCFWLFALVGCKSPPDPILTILAYQYITLLPDDYEQQASCPLIFFLHGRGGGDADVENFRLWGIGEYAEQHEDFPFIVVAPQTSGEWYVEPLDDILNEVIAEYKVDEDRIYVTGLSLGGYGTFLLSFAYPDRFAAIASVAGWGIPEEACKIADLPVWFFHDEGDPVVPFDWAQEMADSLVACGTDVRFTVYEDSTHDAWTEAYSNPELYDWFLSHER